METRQEIRPHDGKVRNSVRVSCITCGGNIECIIGRFQMVRSELENCILQVQCRMKATIPQNLKENGESTEVVE